MQIKKDDLMSPEVQKLLAYHLAEMRAGSPPESTHALDLEALQASNMHVFTAWEGANLLGCGGFKQDSPTHGEIKSMRTDPAHTRKGVARLLLQHILVEARKLGIERLSLETGSSAQFKPAVLLYENFGFDYCQPFGNYSEDPFSVFMTRRLDDLLTLPEEQHVTIAGQL